MGDQMKLMLAIFALCLGTTAHAGAVFGVVDGTMLYIHNPQNHESRQVAPLTLQNGDMASIYDLTYSKGQLYGLDPFSDRTLVKVDPETGKVSGVAELPLDGTINALGALPDGRLVVGAVDLSIYDPASGELSPLTTIGLQSGGDVSYHSDGFLYWSTQGVPASVYRVSLTGETELFAQLPNEEIWGIASLGDKLLVTCPSGRLYEFEPMTRFFSLLREEAPVFYGTTDSF